MRQARAGTGPIVVHALHVWAVSPMLIHPPLAARSQYSAGTAGGIP